jgi:hypothetical protein
MLTGKVIIKATADIARWGVVNSYGQQADSGDGVSENHIIGVTEGAIRNTAYGEATYSGVLFNDQWSWTPGAAIYLNGTALSETPPSAGFVAQIGLAITPESIFINISK